MAQLAEHAPSRSEASTGGYRPDIDGLRAVAVLSVLLFHAGFGAFRFGFIGVDIFFVVSGYLISGLIFGEIKSGEFSFSSFYKRRIVRIIPALSVMTLFVLAFGVIRLFPSELMKLAKSALASATGTSNIFFFLHTNYFEDSAESSPLLHTWSLGVEEQFYLLMPSVLILLKNASPTRRNILLSILFALSLVLSIYWSGQNPPAGFYLLPSRAWELLVGTLAAMRVVPPISRRSYRETAAVLGLAAILLPGMFYDSSVPFPGIAALVPCLGAAVLIVSAESGPTFISRALSLRPVVFVGLISYSLYLWHWPLIVFQSFGRFLNTGISPTVDRVLILPVAVVAATVSWRFVELPFRRVSVPWPRSRRVVR